MIYSKTYLYDNLKIEQASIFDQRPILDSYPIIHKFVKT